MKILHICTADLRHGAGIAAYRLHKALQRPGHTSRLLVAEKTSKDDSVASLLPEHPGLVDKTRRLFQDMIELGMNTFGPQNTFSFFKRTLAGHPWVKDADVIHCHNLHWPFKNFPLDFLKTSLTKPLAWTFHDMWPLTGHCFYSLECEKWRSGCKGGCPQLFAFIPLAWDSSPMQWNIKKRIYAGTPFTIITPSRWLTELAKQSPLLAGHNSVTIPNIVDTKIFAPLDRMAARSSHGFTENEKLVLFIAGNINVPVKGLKTLLDALIVYTQKNPGTRLLLAGHGDIPSRYKTGVKHFHFGRIKDQKALAQVYALADVTVVPSLAETFGNIVAESMACGTPVIGSRVGGIPDMIDHNVNGILYSPGDQNGLIRGLEHLLSDKNIRATFGQRAKAKITEYCDENKIVNAHLNIYNDLARQFKPGPDSHAPRHF